MKNRVGRIVTSLLLGILMLGSTVHAQRNERVIKANIPFDFVVGSQTFPAGRYSVALIGPVLLELRDSEGRALTNVLTHSVQASAEPARSKLRFESEGGLHVLTQVWQEGDDIGQQILQPKSAVRAVQKRSGHVQTAEASNPR
jgi:hypothetical protein